MSATDTVVNQGMHCDLLYWFSKNDRGLRTHHAVGGGCFEKTAECNPQKPPKKERIRTSPLPLSVFFGLQQVCQ
jgi:hypothetical protein